MAEQVYLPHDRGSFLRKVNTFPAGYSNDGIFGYIIDGVKYIRHKKGGVLNCIEAGIYPNSSDMAERINVVYAHPWVKAIEFSIDGEGFILVGAGSTINIPKGKVMKFRAGTRLQVEGTLNGGIVEASEYDWIFEIVGSGKV